MTEVPILPAATILLLRDDPFEVLMVRRHHQIDFASGALVFPGGKTHAGDKDPAWEGHVVGWTSVAAHKRELRIAAVREAFEESGILLAVHEDGRPFDGDPRAAEARDSIARDQASFLELVKTLGLRLDLDALSVFAQWITPDMVPKRFDTFFYVAVAPKDQLATCDGYETVDAEWIHPNEALRLADAGERTIIFPTKMNLKLLAEASSAEDAISQARARKLVPVLPKMEVRDGVRMLTIPADAGYGDVTEPMGQVMREPRAGT